MPISKTLLARIFLSTILLCPLLAFSEEQGQSKVPPKVLIEIGEGRVSVRAEGLDLPEDELKSLETEFLVSEELSHLVITDQKVQLTIEGKALDNLKKKLSRRKDASLKELKDIIRFEARRASGNEKAEAFEEEADQIRLFTGSERVVMGGHTVIREDESISELLVVGGSAEILGHVERLVVLGGVVRIGPSAKISDEMINLGGQVEIDPAAQVDGKRSDVAIPLGDDVWDLLKQSLREKKNRYFSSTPTVIFFFVVKVMVLLIFWFLGEFFAPVFQSKIRENLASSPFRSLGFAFLSLLLIIPLTLMLTLSIVGIPLLPLQFSFIFLFAIYGYVQSATVLATKLPRLKLKQLWMFALLGIFIFEALRWIPLLGAFLVGLFALAGYGAASRAFSSMIFSRRKAL